MVTRVHGLSSRSIGIKRGISAGLLIGAGIVSALWLFSAKPSKNTHLVNASEPIVAAYDMVEVPVPIEPVIAGTKVKDIAFRRISYPRHQVPLDAVTNVSEIADLVATSGLPAHLPLFLSNFNRRNTGLNSVIERIPPGMRAMTIRVDATSAVEGWAGSGSFVDVLLIAHERTSVIAEQVKILSAERIVEPVEGAASPQVPSTVTLLVNQEQCLAINTAIPLGKIAFALRSPDDQEGWDSPQYSAERFKGKGAAIESEKQGVSGYISVSDHNGGKSFALSDGKWIETSIVPEGFRVMDESRAQSILKNGEIANAKAKYSADLRRTIE
jgi:Flp pilus assembly protein CpaB